METVSNLLRHLLPSGGMHSHHTHMKQTRGIHRHAKSIWALAIVSLPVETEMAARGRDKGVTSLKAILHFGGAPQFYAVLAIY